MRSDCASTPTRGSRLVGLLSMIITSVLGSGLREQPARNNTTETQRHREKVSKTRRRMQANDVTEVAHDKRFALVLQ